MHNIISTTSYDQALKFYRNSNALAPKMKDNDFKWFNIYKIEILYFEDYVIQFILNLNENIVFENTFWK